MKPKDKMNELVSAIRGRLAKEKDDVNNLGWPLYFYSFYMLHKLEKILTDLDKDEKIKGEKLDPLVTWIGEYQLKVAPTSVYNKKTAARAMCDSIYTLILQQDRHIQYERKNHNLMLAPVIKKEDRLDENQTGQHLISASYQGINECKNLLEIMSKLKIEYWEDFCKHFPLKELIQVLTHKTTFEEVLKTNFESTGNELKNKALAYCLYDVYERTRLGQGNYKTYTGTLVGTVFNNVNYYIAPVCPTVFNVGDKTRAVYAAKKAIINSSDFFEELYSLNGALLQDNEKHALTEENSELAKITQKVLNLLPMKVAKTEDFQQIAKKQMAVLNSSIITKSQQNLNK